MTNGTAGVWRAAHALRPVRARETATTGQVR
jgi:hypothetical protein